ncbi:retrotransposon protein, putative, ty1-copia subclass [Tanacetum coccineum]
MQFQTLRLIPSLDVLNTHTAWVKASKEIVGLMLMTKDPKIQKNLEHLGSYDMLKELKMLYAQQSYIDNLECLGHAMTPKPFWKDKQSGAIALVPVHSLTTKHQRSSNTQGGYQQRNQSASNVVNVGHWRTNSTFISAVMKNQEAIKELAIPGKYMSQEFLDHLKEHGIISHRTPPYTPQHNGVSERRNRTLLDMVRSMMSQTTLPKSFWDYCPLSLMHAFSHMFPTKKVEKTPYEVGMMQSMRDNKVPELVVLPPKGKTIGHKWLFKRKTDMDEPSTHYISSL